MATPSKTRKYTTDMLDANFNAWHEREEWVNDQLGDLEKRLVRLANATANLNNVFYKMQETFGMVLQQMEDLQSEVREMRHEIDGDIG